MSQRVYNFQDILYVTYYDEDDCLTIDMTWSYLNDNAPFDVSKAVEVSNRVDNVICRGYKYNQDSLTSFTTGVTFHNFKQTVEDCLRPASVGENATDNKNGWTMKTLAELFECEHRSRDDSLPLSKFISLIQISSDGFFLDSTYAVISCLYTLCNGLSVPLVTESGFKLEKLTM